LAGLKAACDEQTWSHQGRKYFFFEKKKQKTFVLLVKVFWFFFSKKNCFFFLPFGDLASVSAAFTDIQAGGWVARAPVAWRPYLLLARLDRPIGIWLLFLPGAWGILLARAPWAETVRLLALFAVGSVVMRAAGCVVNDLWDRDLDRLVTRTAGRPLARGDVSVRQSLVFLAGLLLCGLLVLVQLRPLCWALGVGSLVLVGLYPLAKRVTWWPQLVMGFTFGFGAPMGYAAAAGRIDGSFAAIYAAAIFWDLGFDTIYGFQDIEDDALIGVKSTSRRFAHMPRRFLAASYAASVVCLALAGWLAGAGVAFWPLLLLPAGLMAWQVARLACADPAACLRLFKLNRETGLLLVPALLAARW
jgi:4-hydroxybenzoate polyprenyltransferase